MQTRSVEWGQSHLIPRPWGAAAASGEPVTLASAAGLPAVVAAIRLISETIGSLPCIIYQGRGPERDRVHGSWQWRLLHDAPNLDQSSFDFFADVAASVEATGNAYIQKAKSRRRVEALIPLDPSIVTVERDRGTGEKTFRVWLESRQMELTSADVIHVRGFTLNGGDVGISPIGLCRNALGAALAQDNFQSRFYLNDARPGIVIRFPQGVTAQQAAQWKDEWAADHGGTLNSHKPGVLGGGADITTIPISLEDVQFIEGQRFSVEQIARIFRVPASMLGEGAGDPRGASATNEIEEFAKFSLSPRLRRIELALKSDPDLFQGDMYPEFLAESILRAATEARYSAYLQARQAGWLSMNEIRELENYPPVDGGDVIQETPVGGAPNLQPAPQAED